MRTKRLSAENAYVSRHASNLTTAADHPSRVWSRGFRRKSAYPRMGGVTICRGRGLVETDPSEGWTASEGLQVTALTALLCHGLASWALKSMRVFSLGIMLPVMARLTHILPRSSTSKVRGDASYCAERIFPA